MHFPVSVPAGGSVLVTVDKVAGTNAVIAGLFLGGAGTPPVPPPDRAVSVESPGVQGDWVGNYGADGYVLGGWYGDGDLTSLPLSTLVVQQGARHAWTGTSRSKAYRSRISRPDARPPSITRRSCSSASTSLLPTRAPFTCTCSTGIRRHVARK